MSKTPKSVEARRGRGRPKIGSKALLSPVNMRFPPAMIEAIDAECADRLDGSDRSAMVRELVAEALAARAKARSRK